MNIVEKRSPWVKLLYVKQEYPDNYVGDSFLNEMKKNAYLQSYQYWPTVAESSAVSQHLLCVSIFCATFIGLYNYHIKPTHLIAVTGIMYVLGYFFFEIMLLRSDEWRPKRKKIFKSSFIFFTTLLGLTPILKTLTKDISSDSIWALSVCFLISNIIFHDYSTASTTIIKFTGAISINAAIFASVLLASRLPSNLHVFGLMFYAVTWFALFPILRRQAKVCYPRFCQAFTLAFFFICMYLYWNISKAVVVLHFIGVVCITFICPLMLIHLQKYKDEIHGPWDEALPNLQH